jgi:hypothetical protein
MVDITSWVNNPFQGKDISEVGAVEVVVAFLKEVIKILITVLLQHKFRCHLAHLLTCNGMLRLAIHRIKIPINNILWILKEVLRRRQLVMQTLKLSNASSSTKVNYRSINFCFRKELPLQRSLLLCTWRDRT